ncbi:MAG TPA: hypothetical protein VKX46_13885, partial [Ktedonobacteraceae bacterium]|nr:hypothetical protein [Ktedonobacteraceae bacterium]
MKHRTSGASAVSSALLIELEHARRRRERLWFLGICGVLVFLTPIVVLGVLNVGVWLFVALPVVLVLLIVIARWPQVGFFVIT